MIDAHDLEILTKKLKIAPLNIVREHIELEVLQQFAQAPISTKLVFYGGTALRLAYNSPRYSEDLDFLQVKRITLPELRSILGTLVQSEPSLMVKDLKDKRQTLFGLLNVVHPALKKPLNIKIEISKRTNGVIPEYIPLTSPASHLKPIIPTADLHSLKRLKLKALSGRKEPRDWFDLWYICKLLREPFQPRVKFPFPPREFTRELKRFLPQDKWPLIEQLLS